MKRKGVHQSYTSSLNSEAMACEKSHTTHQVGMWWCAMIIPFRTPVFVLLHLDVQTIIKLKLKQASMGFYK